METKDEDFVVRLFAASTHAPILFFSSKGIVYREKVWRLPQGDPRTKGRSIANILPIEKDEKITTVMPLPEDEDSWGALELMFATRKGNVRRNSLSDFQRVARGGKIAMKFDDEDDQIVDVAICSDQDDVLLTTRLGQCIRFQATDVRVFKGRDSTGVRGITLADGDEVIAMSILRHVDVTAEERATYIKQSRSVQGEEVDPTAAVDVAEDGAEGDIGPAQLSPERYAELSAREQYVLAVAEEGLGKRASSYEYRVTNRGGKGIVAHDLSRRGGQLVAAFPVEESDEVMMVTDGGQLIRTRVDQIRRAGRSTQGVMIIRVSEGERVVSVERLADMGSDEAEGPAEGTDTLPAAPSS
jgi:DNA gyrase subunit A